MNEHDLFAAVGGTEDRFLAELEESRLRRLPRHFGLIAAMLALLLTACAAPVVIRSFDKVTGGDRAETGSGFQITEYSSGSRKSVKSYFVPSGVELEVTVDPEAPQEIEEHFLPLKFLEYCQVESYTDTENEFSLSLSMKVPRYGRAYGIFYRQYVLPEDGHVHLQDILDSKGWERSFQTYGDVNALEFEGHGSYEDSDGGRLLYDGNHVARIYTKQIFWSDGFYLYCLKIPVTYPLTTDKVEEIVTSLTAVEDITEYLPAAE